MVGTRVNNDTSAKASVSVIIPTYNCASFLDQCIESVLNQTYKPSQIIMCDDCSTDGTRDIICRFKDNYPEIIEAVFHKKRMGAARNFNSGILRANRDYLCFCGGDDFWRPEKLRMEIERLSSVPCARWAYSRSVIIDAHGQRLELGYMKSEGIEGNILFPLLSYEMYLRNWLAERSLVEQVGLFDENLILFEDWDFKIRLASKAEIVFVDSANVKYRKRGGGLSNSPAGLHLVSLESIYKKHRDLISSLNPPQRSYVLKRKHHVLLDVYLKMARESLRRSDYNRAIYRLITLAKFIKYCIKQPSFFHLPLLLRIMLPNNFYRNSARIFESLLGRGSTADAKVAVKRFISGNGRR